MAAEMIPYNLKQVQSQPQGCLIKRATYWAIVFLCAATSGMQGILINVCRCTCTYRWLLVATNILSAIIILSCCTIVIRAIFKIKRHIQENQDIVNSKNVALHAFAFISFGIVTAADLVV